jgi:alpha-glucosidase
MLHTLRGTPFVYQGEELGLPDAEIPPERVVDVDGRDPERAPIPWRPPSAAGPGAGFTDGEPWLPVVAQAEELCVERQASDPDSTLSLARRLGALRAATPTLQTGSQVPVDAGPDVLAWIREDGRGRLLAAVNFASTPVPLRIADGDASRARVLLSSEPDRPGGETDLAELTLAGTEALLLELDPLDEPG